MIGMMVIKRKYEKPVIVQKYISDSVKPDQFTWLR